MIIPWDRLNEATLHNLLEEYVSRDGTDYGMQEISLHSKVSQVQRQLSRGDLLLVWDHESETCNLMPKEQYQTMQPGAQQHNE